MKKGTAIIKGYEGVFRVSTDQKYAILSYEENGILIKLSNTSVANKQMFAISESSVSQIVLPAEIRLAYGIEREFDIQEIGNNLLFIEGKRLHMPHVYDSNKKYVKAPSKGISTKRKHLHYGKMSLSNAAYSMYKVEIYTGEKNYARFTPISDCEGLYSLEKLKSVYGANYLYYPYKNVEYYIQTQGIFRSVQIPVYFLRKWGEDTECDVDVTELSDGSIIIAPVSRECAIDGTEINPVDEPINKVHVCEDCASDKDELGEMIALIKGITQMVSEIKKVNETLLSRVSAVENALK